MKLDKATKTAQFDAPILTDVLRHAQGIEPGAPTGLDIDVVDPNSVADLPAPMLRGAIRECRSILRQLGARNRKRPENGNFVTWFELMIESFTLALDGQERRLSTDPELCSSCATRERRFGDLCGRCAEAAGVRPKGKIS